MIDPHCARRARRDTVRSMTCLEHHVFVLETPDQSQCGRAPIHSPHDTRHFHLPSPSTFQQHLYHHKFQLKLNSVQPTALLFSSPSPAITQQPQSKICLVPVVALAPRAPRPLAPSLRPPGPPRHRSSSAPPRLPRIHPCSSRRPHSRRAQASSARWPAPQRKSPPRLS